MNTRAAYALAVVAPLGAFVLSLALWRPSLEVQSLALFFGAVVLAAWAGGLGPGLVATALGTAGVAWLLLGNADTRNGLTDELLRLTLFVCIALVTTALNEARARAERRHAELLVKEKVARARAELSEQRHHLYVTAARALRGANGGAGALARVLVPHMADACTVVGAPDGRTLGPDGAGLSAGARAAAADALESAATVIQGDDGHHRLAVPIARQGRAAGVLVVERRREFTAGDARFFEEIAGLVADVRAS